MMTIATIWEEFLQIIKQEAGSRVVDTWFKAVTLREWNASHHTVTLTVPNQFVCDWIKSHYTTLMATHLSRLLHVSTVKLAFRVMDHEVAEAQLIEPVLSTSTPVVIERSAAQETRSSSVAPLVKKRSAINSTYTFETFVVGPSNSLAYAACQAVAQSPGNTYNPIFLYGGSGLGKTHLLHAIGNKVKELNPNAVVLYQTVDRFVNEFIHAIRFDKTYLFQERYKSVDLLLIDDIQFISNKEQTQEAFFNIFNTLYDCKKQIVFTSDTVPQDIKGLAERLRSRLAWGLVADLSMPSLETKIAILKKKAESSSCQGYELNDDVAHFIASQVVGNIRELEGALIRVIAFASLTGKAITLDLAHQVLGKEHTVNSSLVVDFSQVARCLGNHYPYSLQDLRSKDRNKELSFVRQLAMFFMKKLTDKSLRDIGSFLGGRDHSTVLHAIDKVQGQINNDDLLRHRLHVIEKEIISSSG